MKPDVARIVKDANLDRWKPIQVEYGHSALRILAPDDCRVLEMPETPALGNPREAIRRSIQQPIGGNPLPTIVRDKAKPAGDLTVCITTSDITRPVPYKGEAGILPPLLELLLQCGIRREHITLLVGTGTHRPSTPAEKIAMFGADVVAQYKIVDHDCDDDAMLVDLGKTQSGTAVRVNRRFVEADVKIATALVESHFMAGASGGRKAVCPALVSKETIEKFHSAAFLDSPRATNLVLTGNPCHEEAVEIATKVGVDFIINTVLNRRLELVEVFSGHLVLAHQQAVELLRRIVAIPVEREFDIVLTHGGYVGTSASIRSALNMSSTPSLRCIESPLKVRSATGDSATAPAGSNNPSSRARKSSASVRLPPAESPATTMRLASKPCSRSHR